MIDMHHHLVHQIDDGAQSFADTQNMLIVAGSQGISQIITTPHAMPGREYFDMDRYMEHLRMAQDWCAQNGMPITLHAGAELFYTEHTVRLLDEKRVPTLAGSRYVLLEFSTKAPVEYLCRAAQQLGSAGYYPIFAHIERYECLRKLRSVRMLKEEYQVLMQMNARTVLRPKRLLDKRWYQSVMKAGMIDFIASDAHNTQTRRCCMEESRREIAAQYGETVADRLFGRQAGALLKI